MKRIACAWLTVWITLLGLPGAGGPAGAPPPVAAGWQPVGPAGFSDGAVDWPALAVDGQGRPYVPYRDYGSGYRATVMRFLSPRYLPLVLREW